MPPDERRSASSVAALLDRQTPPPPFSHLMLYALRFTLHAPCFSCQTDHSTHHSRKLNPVSTLSVSRLASPPLPRLLALPRPALPFPRSGLLESGHLAIIPSTHHHHTHGTVLLSHCININSHSSHSSSTSTAPPLVRLVFLVIIKVSSSSCCVPKGNPSSPPTCIGNAPHCSFRGIFWLPYFGARN